MKHILNNISEVEKRAIREQHEGGMKIDTSRFRKLMESKLGNSKPLVSEQGSMYSDFDLERMRSGEDLTYTPNKGGDLRTDIMKMIHNSNSPNEDIVRTLRSIADEMESSGKLKKDVRDRFTDFESSISERHSRRKSLMEQGMNCSELKMIPKSGRKGLQGGGEPQSTTWKEDIAKIGNAETTYMFEGPLLDAMNTQRKCHRAKTDVTYSEFKRDNGNSYTLIGID